MQRPLPPYQPVLVMLAHVPMPLQMAESRMGVSPLSINPYFGSQQQSPYYGSQQQNHYYGSPQQHSMYQQQHSMPMYQQVPYALPVA